MKRVFGLFLLLFLVAIMQLSQPTVARMESVSATQSKDFKKTVAVENGADFRLETDKGSVRLTAWDSNQVEISARIDPPENESTDYQTRAVEAVRIEVLGGGGSLTVRSNFEDVPYKNQALGRLSRSRNLPDIHYEIRAPRNLNIHIELDRSKLSIEGFKGRVNLEADRTPVTARDIEGDFRLNVDRGTANLANLKGSIKLDADRTDGEILAAQINGDSTIDIDRGEIDLRLSESQGLSVKTEFSKRTRFNSDFPIATTTLDRASFEGTINGGGPRLLIRSDRGTIKLKRQ